MTSNGSSITISSPASFLTRNRGTTRVKNQAYVVSADLVVTGWWLGRLSDVWSGRIILPAKAIIS